MPRRAASIVRAALPRKRRRVGVKACNFGSIILLRSVQRAEGGADFYVDITLVSLLTGSS
jgi:hypothetical protein